MKKNHKPQNPSLLIVIGLIISLFWFASCVTLQKQTEYQKYTKNNEWRINKL